MHFWIDKRSPYGFGRGARVSGSGFGQYPRRLRPSKPWSQNNRHAATTPTSIDRNSYPGSHGDHQATAAAAAGAEPSDASASSSPSYCKWSLWAIAIGLSSLLVYIICAKLYNEHQLFTFCALLAVFFILGVCTVSNMFRRTTAQPLAAGNAPQVLRQESSSSSSRNTSVTAPAAGPASSHPHQSQQQQQQHPHHNHHHHHHHHNHHQSHHTNNNQHSNYVPDNRSPSISIHNLAESPTPTYHNSHNQV